MEEVQNAHAVVFLWSYVWGGEVVVCFVGIGGIVDHHNWHCFVRSFVHSDFFLLCSFVFLFFFCIFCLFVCLCVCFCFLFFVFFFFVRGNVRLADKYGGIVYLHCMHTLFTFCTLKQQSASIYYPLSVANSKFAPIF